MSCCLKCIVLWNSSKVHPMHLQLESIYRQRTTQELQILTMDYVILIFVFSFLYHNNVVMCFFFWCQTTSKSVTVNPIQSLSINIPHTAMCKFVLLKWIYGIHNKCSLLHFNTVTVIQTVAIVYIRKKRSNYNNIYNDLLYLKCSLSKHRIKALYLIILYQTYQKKKKKSSWLTLNFEWCLGV